MNRDTHLIFENYKKIIIEQQNLGNIVNPINGGDGGDWAGSLPKLISLLPMGNWNPSSQKRSNIETQSGNMSDHYEGNRKSYAADFSLNGSFNSNVENATKFAIDIARKVDPSVSSWEPYKGKVFNGETPDGYRIQIIWLSNVGGNHYDHVHVGVKKTSASGETNTKPDTDETDGESTEQTDDSKTNQNDDGGFLGEIKRNTIIKLV